MSDLAGRSRSAHHMFCEIHEHYTTLPFVDHVCQKQRASPNMRSASFSNFNPPCLLSPETCPVRCGSLGIPVWLEHLPSLYIRTVALLHALSRFQQEASLAVSRRLQIRSGPDLFSPYARSPGPAGSAHRAGWGLV